MRISKVRTLFKNEVVCYKAIGARVSGKPCALICARCFDSALVIFSPYLSLSFFGSYVAPLRHGLSLPCLWMSVIYLLCDDPFCFYSVWAHRLFLYLVAFLACRVM